MKTSTSETPKDLIPVWFKIGKSNRWIKNAHDPIFEEKSIKICNSVEELKNYIGQGNWCLGTGFAYLNLCFINQIDGGDEWLTIKDDYSFESITFQSYIKDNKFEDMISTFLSASKSALITLQY